MGTTPTIINPYDTLPAGFRRRRKETEEEPAASPEASSNPYDLLPAGSWRRVKISKEPYRPPRTVTPPTYPQDTRTLPAGPSDSYRETHREAAVTEPTVKPEGQKTPTVTQAVDLGSQTPVGPVQPTPTGERLSAPMPTRANMLQSQTPLTAPAPLRPKGPVPTPVVPLSIEPANAQAPKTPLLRDGTTVPMDVFSRTSPPPGSAPGVNIPQVEPVPAANIAERAYRSVLGGNTIPGKMKELITRGGFAKEEAMATPLVDLSQFAPEDAPLVQGVAEALSQFTSPESVMMIAGTGALGHLAKGPFGRAVSLGFTVDMLDEFPEQGAAFRQALAEQRFDDAERVLGQMLVQGGAAAMAGAHAQFEGRRYKDFPQARQAVRSIGEAYRSAQAQRMEMSGAGLSSPVGVVEGGWMRFPRGGFPREAKSGEIITDQPGPGEQRLLAEGESRINPEAEPIKPKPFDPFETPRVTVDDILGIVKEREAARAADAGKVEPAVKAETKVEAPAPTEPAPIPPSVERRYKPVVQELQKAHERAQQLSQEHFDRLKGKYVDDTAERRAQIVLDTELDPNTRDWIKTGLEDVQAFRDLAAKNNVDAEAVLREWGLPDYWANVPRRTFDEPKVEVEPFPLGTSLKELGTTREETFDLPGEVPAGPAPDTVARPTPDAGTFTSGEIPADLAETPESLKETPAEQEAVEIADEAQWKKIQNAYSGDRIAEKGSKLRDIIKSGEKLYAITSGQYGARETHSGYEVVPQAEYKGQTISYSEKPFGLGYEGVRVTHKGKPYVMTGRKIHFVQPKEEQGEITAEPQVTPETVQTKSTATERKEFREKWDALDEETRMELNDAVGSGYDFDEDTGRWYFDDRRGAEKGSGRSYLSKAEVLAHEKELLGLIREREAENRVIQSKLPPKFRDPYYDEPTVKPERFAIDDVVNIKGTNVSGRVRHTFGDQITVVAPDGAVYKRTASQLEKQGPSTPEQDKESIQALDKGMRKIQEGLKEPTVQPETVPSQAEQESIAAKVAKLELENEALRAGKGAKPAGKDAAATAGKLRDLAEAMESQIEGRMNPATANQNPTPRRMRILEGMRREGESLQKVQARLRQLADAHEAGTVPPILSKINSKALLDYLGWKYFHGNPGQSSLTKAGITSQAQFEEAKKALESLGEIKAKETPVERQIRDKIRALVGRKIPGFVPTPRALAKRAVEAAELERGMYVLEPSAGIASMADEIEAVTGQKPDVAEISSELREILKLKGYEPFDDFLTMNLKGERPNFLDVPYDAIVMNPPFEGGAEMDHVRHAYDLVKPGGRVVSIMSAGPFFRSDKKATAFREWFDQVGGQVEDNPAGSFTGAEALRQSGVATKLVVIDKPGKQTEPESLPEKVSESKPEVFYQEDELKIRTEVLRHKDGITVRTYKGKQLIAESLRGTEEEAGKSAAKQFKYAIDVEEARAGKAEPKVQPETATPEAPKFAESAKSDAPYVPKEPWQMTRAEWERRNVEGAGIRGPGSPHIDNIANVKPKVAAGGFDRVMLPDGSIWDYKGVSAYKVDNEGRVNGWERVDEDIYRRSEHRKAVEKAIKEGKPVPERVVKEFQSSKAEPTITPEAPKAVVSEAKITTKPEPVVKPETIKVVETAKGEVNVSIPDAHKVKTTLKEQKTYLLAEIDKALELVPEKFDEKNTTVNIEVPGDGQFKVLNNKNALTEFRRRVSSQFPTGEGAKKSGPSRPPMTQSNKRMTGEGVEYYNPYRARKMDVIPGPVDMSRGKDINRNFVHEGWFSTGHFAILAPPPKGITPVPEPKLAKWMEVPSGLSEGKVVGEFYFNPPPKPKESPVSYQPGHRPPEKPKEEEPDVFEGGMPYPFVHLIDKLGNEAFLDADYVDMVMTKYPNAKPFLGEETGPVHFFDEGKHVALIMPIGKGKGRQTAIPHSLIERAEEVVGGPVKKNPEPAKPLKPGTADVTLEAVKAEFQRHVNKLLDRAKDEREYERRSRRFAEMGRIDKKRQALEHWRDNPPPDKEILDMWRSGGFPKEPPELPEPIVEPEAKEEPAATFGPIPEKLAPLIQPNGNLTRGMDYVRTLIHGHSKAELDQALAWTRAQRDPHVPHSVIDEINEALRDIRTKQDKIDRLERENAALKKKQGKRPSGEADVGGYRSDEITVNGKVYRVRGNHTRQELESLFKSFKDKYPTSKLDFERWLVERGKVYFRVPERGIPSGEASGGGYRSEAEETPAEPIDPADTYADPTRARIEMPELIEIAQAINENKIPGLRKSLGQALGRFYHVDQGQGETSGEIRLRRDLFIGPSIAEKFVSKFDNVTREWHDFKQDIEHQYPGDPDDLHFTKDYDKRKKRWEFTAYRKDPSLAPRVLAHELGHLIDWIGDPENAAAHKIMDRGNILGRIASLHSFLKHTMLHAPGGELRGTMGILKDEDRQRIRKRAEQLLREDSETEIDEVIKQQTPYTPDEILAIWRNTVATADGIDKQLYQYIASLDRAAKKQVIVDAMAGRVPGPPVFPDFPQKTVEVATGRKIKKHTKEGKPEEVAKLYRDLIIAEIKKRRLFESDAMKEELKAVSQYWKPFNADLDPGYTSYRFSGKELYADAFSVLMNRPDKLAEMAPTFHRGVFNYLEQKPQFKDIYDQVQTRLGGGGGGNVPPRLDRIREMFEEGGERREQLNQRRRAEAHDATDWLARQLIDRGWQALKPMKEAAKSGGLLQQAGQQAQWDLEEIQYVSGEAENYLRDISVEILKPMKKAGLDAIDVGTYLMLQRVGGDRELLANPLGYTPKTAADTLRGMREKMGDEKFQKLKDLAKAFRRIREDLIIPRAEASRMYGPKILEMMRDNKQYVRFSVSKYLDKTYGPGVSARVYKQVGTLSGIENPFVVTALQDMAVLRAAKLNEAKLSLIETLQLTDPELFSRADMRWSDDEDRHVPKDPKNPRQALMTVIRDGQPEHYYVSAGIAEAYEAQPFEAGKIAEIWNALMQPIRAALVSLNPIWMARNVPRDFRQTVKNIPEVKLHDAPALARIYGKAFREAWREIMRGERSDDIREMMKGRMMLPGRAFSTKEENFENELERLANEFRIDTGEAEQAQGIRGRMSRLIDALHRYGRVSELTGKVAGYKYLQAHGKRDKQEVGHVVRTRVGTPDVKRRGAAQAITNNLFLFSNVNKEGQRAAWESFKEDRAGYVWKTIAMNILPKLLLAGVGAGLAGEFMRRVVEGIPESDKSQYTVVPLGLDKNGKSIYLRIPEDYEGQYFGALFRALTQGRIRGKGGAINQTWEQVPWSTTKTNPAIGVTLDLLEYYGLDNNPTDTYRGRPIIGEQAFEAGGWEASKDLLKHSWRELGGTMLYDPAYGELVRTKSPVEEILRSFPGNILGTFLKFSDRGIADRLREVSKEVRGDKASSQLDVTKRIQRSINAATKQKGAPDRGDMRQLYLQLRNEGKLTKDTSENEFGNRYFRWAARVPGNPYVEGIINAQSNAEKERLLSEYRRMLSPGEYEQVLGELLRARTQSKNSLMKVEKNSRREPTVQVER